MKRSNSFHSQRCLDAITLKNQGTRDYQSDLLALGDRVVFALEQGVLREGIVIDDCAGRSFALIALKSTKTEDVMLIEPSGCIKVPT
jgi:hypothetical protein